MARVEWDESAFQAWLRDPNGPVARVVLPRLGREITDLAKARFHRITGETADSIGFVVESGSQGPVCSIGGSYVIGFLEKPAGQMHSPHRWLTDAARTIAGG